ncbi:MAG: DeoR/GlpR transcriptional regulator [Spirochaetaceae bacterium]|nr:MAG: DeoR/GlpR transcriptional regulator [Spirochaetaceae bacterium]
MISESERGGTVFAEERQAQVVEYVHKHKKATVHDLTAVFSVSSATIRNDLRALERRGLLLRTHGGAMVTTKTRYEEALQERHTHNLQQKQMIANAALSLIDDGDTIILDTGTTVLELARLLFHKRDLTVITNDIEIARVLADSQDGTLILIGGVVRKQFRCAVGSLSSAILAGLLVDKAFMAANNFDLHKGASTPDLDQADTKKAMIAVASKRFLLCDHEKFGTQSFAQFAAVKDFDVIVSDRFEPREQRLLEQLGVEALTP